MWSVRTANTSWLTEGRAGSGEMAVAEMIIARVHLLCVRLGSREHPLERRDLLLLALAQFCSLASC